MAACFLRHRQHNRELVERFALAASLCCAFRAAPFGGKLGEVTSKGRSKASPPTKIRRAGGPPHSLTASQPRNSAQERKAGEIDSPLRAYALTLTKLLKPSV